MAPRSRRIPKLSIFILNADVGDAGSAIMPHIRLSTSCNNHASHTTSVIKHELLQHISSIPKSKKTRADVWIRVCQSVKLSQITNRTSARGYRTQFAHDDQWTLFELLLQPTINSGRRQEINQAEEFVLLGTSRRPNTRQSGRSSQARLLEMNESLDDIQYRTDE